MGWIVSSTTGIYYDGMLTAPSFDAPFPYAMWCSGNNKVPWHSGEPTSPAISAPFPSVMWVAGGGLTPYRSGEPTSPQMGAFANATDLVTATIPIGVKKIGRNSFTNTALTSVTIASDCAYHDTSFPDGCEINLE